jgi:hypothetical protein
LVSENLKEARIRGELKRNKKALHLKESRA